jgi:hypothetical protein
MAPSVSGTAKADARNSVSYFSLYLFIDGFVLFLETFIVLNCVRFLSVLIRSDSVA